MNQDEKDVAEIAAAGVGAWLIFKVVKWLAGWLFIAAVIYFAVHYLVGWHLVWPVLGLLFSKVHDALVQIFTRLGSSG